MGNPKGRPRAHGWRVGSNGYRVLFDLSHEFADKHGYVLEHIAVASAVLGKRLPTRAQVHHVNGDKTDNRPANLVICEDRAYHMLLHQRQTALLATGNPNARKCAYCSAWDSPENLIPHGKRSVVHRACVNAYQRQRYHNSKAII